MKTHHRISKLFPSSINRAGLGITLCCALMFAPGILSAQTEDSTLELPLPLDEVRIFTEVLNRIRSAYVEPIDDKTLLENAIKGMLAGIDPHSTYLAANDYDQLQESTTG